MHNAYNQSIQYLWALLVIAATLVLFSNYRYLMDVYETSFLFLAGVAIVYVGFQWTAIKILILAVSICSILSILLYDGNLDHSSQYFLLHYGLASQAAIMWMSALFVTATATYLLWFYNHSAFTAKIATTLTWCAIAMGFIGLLVRWHESYLIGADIGHIPISNLYEVFILFCLITALIYQHYEKQYQTPSMGVFVLPIITAAICFLLWYTFENNAHQIQPLVPALNSYWMKIHVPANFIGYGCFSIAAMLSIAYLLYDYIEHHHPQSALLVHIPNKALLDEVIYKVITLGFAFFTVATILGALWAAEAWGGYWSWDPKETWALIVWLNYAAWLHMHMTKGWRGVGMAWWSIIGLFITLFAFLGVNIFLSGLHSYGEL